MQYKNFNLLDSLKKTISFKTIFSSYQNKTSFLFGLILALTIILILIFGSAVHTQGLIYLSYIAGIIPIIYFKIPRHFSRQFLFFLFGFLILWISTAWINYKSGTLESGLINFNVLSYHVFFFTLIISIFYLWQKQEYKNDLCIFLKTIFYLTLPIFSFLYFKIIYEIFILGKEAAWGYTYRHLDAEMFLIWLISSFFIHSRWIKLLVAIIVLSSMHFMSVRGGFLAGFLFIFFSYFLPWLKKFKPSHLLIFFVISSFIGYIFFYEIYFLLNKILLLDSSPRGINSGFTLRTSVWKIAWEHILADPWTGIGYYIRPNPLSDPFNSGLHVHNFFLRIWVENGTPLFLYVCLTLLMTAYNIERKKLTWERGAFWAILFYYFFIPRHIQLNPMSIILYLIVIRSFLANNKLINLNNFRLKD